MNLFSAISDQVSTPFYAYDENILERQLLKINTGKPTNLEVFYAMKGNSNLSILRWFKAQGLGTEIASGGELFLAQTAGFESHEIIYTGPAKTNEELEEAVLAGIKTIHVESLREAERLSDICKKMSKSQDILLRVNAAFEVKTQVQLSGCPSPFGVSEEDLEAVLPNLLKLENLTFKGIHVYNASGILDYTLLLQNVENVFNLVKNLESKLNIHMPIIDFGGGLGIDYSERNNHVNVAAFYAGMEKLINDFNYQDRVLVMEIARFLVAEAGSYVTRVIDKKYSRGEVFLITDGGMHHFMRTALFGTNHSATVLQLSPSDETETVNVTGALCTNVDVLLNQAELPKAEVGDLVVIKKAGCYGLNAAMNHFLGHKMPAEVLIENQNFTVIRQPGRHEDLLLNQGVERSTDNS